MVLSGYCCSFPSLACEGFGKVEREVSSTHRNLSLSQDGEVCWSRRWEKTGKAPLPQCHLAERAERAGSRELSAETAAHISHPEKYYERPLSPFLAGKFGIV